VDNVISFSMVYPVVSRIIDFSCSTLKSVIILGKRTLLQIFINDIEMGNCPGEPNQTTDLFFVVVVAFCRAKNGI
jgi:hypothetical protein